jgi:hypothetical protein
MPPYSGELAAWKSSHDSRGRRERQTRLHDRIQLDTVITMNSFFALGEL